MKPHLPLSGIRVLDFTLVWAGPYAVAMLSDLGAEVIRVESCQHHITNTRGYYARPAPEIVPRMGPVARAYADLDPGDDPWNRHAVFNHIGRDRYSVTVDMRMAEGQRIVHELVMISDVIMDNNTPGLLAKFDLDYKKVHALNPTLIYVAMPIYGFSGPYRDHLGFGANAEALAGFSSLRSYTDGDPTTIGTSNHMDATTGAGAAYAALTAIYQRRRTGKGQLVELCQLENLTQQAGEALMDAAMNGRDRAGMGNRDAVRAPQGIYPCQGNDGWLALSVGTNAEWAGLCHAMGEDGLEDDPRYGGCLARQARHDELDARISAWTRLHDNRDLMTRLQELGVPAAMVAMDSDVFGDPHLEARGFFRWADHAAVGRRRYPGHTFVYRDTPLRYEHPAPLLGQHNDLVYRQLLAKSPEALQALAEQGHIGTGYTDEAIRNG
ncbi:MAG: CoA transferase [Verrucomicrobia bacterium]|nr:CoA transferase [Verrucomicrobiota bacterium]